MHQLSPKTLFWFRWASRGIFTGLALIVGWFHTGAETTTIHGHLLAAVGVLTVIAAFALWFQWAFRKA